MVVVDEDENQKRGEKVTQSDSSGVGPERTRHINSMRHTRLATAPPFVFCAPPCRDAGHEGEDGKILRIRFWYSRCEGTGCFVAIC